MDFGALMFFTDYAIPATELAQALEARGFESVWAPEHSHIPISRKSIWPGGGELPKVYYDAMDPFVSLTAAAVATKALKVATGVCLVQQRDPHPDGKTRRLDRPRLGRAVSLRHRRRVEPRRDREPRHCLQNPLQEDARAD